MANERREFLKVLGGLGAVAAAGAGCDPPVAPGQGQFSGNTTTTATTSATAAAYTAGRIALELEGAFAGWLASYEGGATVGRVVREGGAGSVQRKHLAGVRTQGLTVRCPNGMSQAFYGWVQDSFQGAPARDGAIVLLDLNGASRARLEFTGGVIAELSMPALDASSTDLGLMTLRISPATVALKKGDGSKPGYPSQPHVPRWLVSNFRLQIDGLEPATARVGTIDALTFRRREERRHDGVLALEGREGGEGHAPQSGLEVPDLVFSTPEVDADTLLAWEQDFLVDGNDGEDREKNGTLQLLAPDLQTSIFTLVLKHLGIFRLTPPPGDSSTETIRQVTAGLYCEEMDLSVGA